MVSLSVFAYRLWVRCIKIQVIGLLAVILALPSGVWAKPTTAEQARTVVRNWLSLEAAPLGAALGAAQSRQVLEVKTYKHQGAPAYYVVYLNPAGLVIVPADDLVEPIIAFLPTGGYDPSPVNCLGAMVSQDLVGRVLDARQKEKQAQTQGLPLAPTEVYAGAQRKWALLAKGPTAAEAAALAQPTISDVRVAPLVKSAWGQSLVGDEACYNYYTPPNDDGSANNYLCGCVATAMAQLMRFHAYPDTGVGTTEFDITVDGFNTKRRLRGGDGAGGPYNWGSMPLIPGYSFTEAQRQAIGALTADAGVSVWMDYTAHGSGINTTYAAQALCNTFKYSNAKSAWPGDITSSIPAADRNNMVNPNLDHKCPTLLNIRGSAGGHAIVCDGYGYNFDTLYHHLNMGWSGADDVWYNLPLVDTSWTTFTLQIRIVYNVFPTAYTGTPSEIISGRVTDAAGNPIKGVMVSAPGYTCSTNANGIYSLRVASGATMEVRPYAAGTTFTPEFQSVTTGTSTDNSTITGNRWGINFVTTTMSNALGNSVLPFYSSGSGGAKWYVDTSDVGGGRLRSGQIGSLGWTTLGTTVEGPGVLTFHWQVSGYHPIPLYSMLGEIGLFGWTLDGTGMVAPVGGEAGGGGTITVPAGTHKIEWGYHREVYDGPAWGDLTFWDRAWMDWVVYTAPRTITASAGPNGSISPAGEVTVSYGASRTYTITPDTGYYVADVLVNGDSEGEVTSYTVKNITTDSTIEASFAKYPTPTITATAQPHGSIWPAGVVPVEYGDSRTFFIKPWGGYRIKQVLVDGVPKSPVTTATGTSYTFNNVTGDHTLIVSFEEKPHSVLSALLHLLLN